MNVLATILRPSGLNFKNSRPIGTTPAFEMLKELGWPPEGKWKVFNFVRVFDTPELAGRNAVRIETLEDLVMQPRERLEECYR